MKIQPCANPSCGRQTCPKSVWAGASHEERRRMAARNIYGCQARGLCGRCYFAARRDGRVDDYSRANRDRREVIAELAHIGDRGDMPRDRYIAVMAPRLGMTHHALEKALDRAQAAGEWVA